MAFLSIKQAAEQFGTSVHTLRAVAKSGRLPGARKIGGQWYVHCRTLEHYFETAAPALAEAHAA